MTLLLTITGGAARSLLPAGLDHAAAHAALRQLLGVHAGAECSGLFAEARLGPAGLAFHAPPGRVARFDELDATGQARLRAEIGRLFALLRSVAEEAAARDPARHSGLPALVRASSEVLGPQGILAVEGRPVLAGWGFAPTDAPQGLRLLAGLPGVAPRKGAPLPLLGLGLGLGALGLLGVIAAIGLPLLFGAGQVCTLGPGALAGLEEMQQERDRESLLRTELGRLQAALRERRAQCPAPARSCNEEATSGGQGMTVIRHALPAAPGRVTLNFNAQNEPDHFEVLQRGRVIAQSNGFQAGAGRVAFDWRPPAGAAGEDLVLEVRVTGNPGSRTTVWNYNLGCPQ
jgi:hypothetical protein